MNKLEKRAVIKKTISFVKSRMGNENTGHDWWHVDRVYQNALFLAKSEHADMFVVSLAALLHDIADHKFHNGDHSIGPRVAGEWLKKCKVDSDCIEHVCSIIADLSFKGANVRTKMETIEGKIVQDADRLESMGATGIARTFAYGGHKGHKIYNPSQKPTMHKSFEDYKKAKSTSINHFYEKLLLLKDRMNTKAAKKIAMKRHKYMVNFLDTFLKESHGKK